MFTQKTFAFLRDLERNNNKAWFTKNKPRYEEDLLEPMLQFIRSMAPRLAKISPHIRASDKKVGGALMRIYRDTRFSKDKSPYNTFLAARFAHEAGNSAGGIGFYFRVTATGCALGTGIWQPETALAGKIRTHIAKHPKEWKAAKTAKAFRDTFGDLAGESLKRPPKGFDPEHVHIEDLKRKDFVAFTEWKPAQAKQPDVVVQVAKAYRGSAKLVAFLCDAMGLPF